MKDGGTLEFLFHPRSVALVGITVANPQHWTRTFLDSFLEFGFTGPLYLVNSKGGEIKGLPVYRSLDEVPAQVDYVVSTVPAKAAADLIRTCSRKGVKTIHFCTAGFSETGEEDGSRLEAELASLAKEAGIRVLGPNCMGIYCPASRLSFNVEFPKATGSVGFISQSGGNATDLIMQAGWRNVRFSKVVSYGNACDVNECDLIDYLAGDPETKVIALYIEGVKDGRRFRLSLERAAALKPVVLLKGGVTDGGARAAAGHTGSMAGSLTAWESLCRQLGVLRVDSLGQLADVLVTLTVMPEVAGDRVALVGFGGGASVLITDIFESKGLRVPPIAGEVGARIREFSPVAGNILKNPIDYSQSATDMDKLARVTRIVSEWDGVDFLMGFFRIGSAPSEVAARMTAMAEGLLGAAKAGARPVAVVIEPSLASSSPESDRELTRRLVSSGVAVYDSFEGAASAIRMCLDYRRRRSG